MSSSTQKFPARPPLRASTQSAPGPKSPGYSTELLSPTSSMSDYGASSPTSPAEESFFGAIASKMRRGRSRSRSRTRVSRSRSRSPMMLPPQQIPSSRSAAQPSSPTYVPTRSQTARHSMATAPFSPTSAHSPTPRPILQNQRRGTSGSDPWRGRHANDWLFDGFSFKDKTKKIFSPTRNSRS